jgi:hypothetical protein
MVSLEHALSRRLTVGLGANLWGYEEFLKPPGTDLAQNTLSLSTAWTHAKFSARLSLETGRTEDRKAGVRESFNYGTLTGYFQPTQWLSVSTFVATGDSRYSMSEGNRTTIGFSTGAQLGWSSKLTLAGSQSFTSDRHSSRQTSLTGRLSHDFGRGHSASVGGRLLSSQGGPDDTGVFASYRVAFRTPLPARRGGSRLAGTIQMLDGAGPRPLSGVIFNIGGQRAVSSGGGKFVFNRLKPGRHLLQVDQASLGLSFILNHSAPMYVEVDPNSQVEVRLTAFAAAKVRGRVMCYREELMVPPPDLSGALSAPKYVPAGGLANQLVELTNGGERRRVFTDAEGRFQIDRLPPGAWTLSVSGESLSGLHRLEQSKYSFEIHPGDAREVEIRVLPVARPIRLINTMHIQVRNEY